MNATKMENDPVVKEIPVFLSKTLADKLYLVQYPAYITDGYANATILKTSIKPENKKINMEFAIDTLNEQSYDSNMGKQMALIVDKSKKDEDKIFNSELMDKIVLTSERTLSDCSNFAIGVFQDDELHITPLKGMLHMKLQCDYLDENDKRSKDGAKGTGEDGDKDEDAMPVQVTFAKHLPDNLKRMQEQSFQHHTKKSQEEPWIHTSYIPFYDSQTELTRMEMFCPSADESVNLNLVPKNYLSVLVPAECNSREYDNQTDFHVITKLPLLDQLRIIMKHVKVIAFATLCEFLSPEHDQRTVLKYMQQVAVLVQGNWVVNSELIYPSLSVQSGISELMCKARDYILLLFTEHQYLKRNAVSAFIKLPSDEINQIFAELGIYESQKGWRLKQPPNLSFCNTYPDIAQRQEMVWDTNRKRLREMIDAYNQPPQRQRRKSNRESLGSENEERNVGRGRKSLRDSSLSDNDGEPVKHKKGGRSRKVSETTT